MSLTKRNTRLIALASLLLPLIVFTLSPARTRATQQRSVPQQDGCEDADSRLLSLLDERIQQRFQDIDKGFGYRRIIKFGDTPHRFKPENAKELNVVDELKTARLNVVLYIAGRQVLGEKPDSAAIVARRLIQGPATVVSTEQRNRDLPGPAELWDQSRTAMLAFENSQAYSFAVGKWKFSARPVRATSQSCLDCHDRSVAAHVLPPRDATPLPMTTRTLRIGDLLGVVLYAYEHQTN